MGYLPTLLRECILASLMVYKGWKAFKFRLKETVFGAIFQDSAIYFIGQGTGLLINMVMLKTVRSSLAFMGLGLQTSITCILGSRLILNVRRLYYIEYTEETEHSRRAELLSQNGFRFQHREFTESQNSLQMEHL